MRALLLALLAPSLSSAQPCTDVSGVYDDQPHWSGGRMSQTACAVQYSRQGSGLDGCSGTVSGSALQWAGGCGGATGTLAGDVMTWADGNTWERRPGSGSRACLVPGYLETGAASAAFTYSGACSTTPGGKCIRSANFPNEHVSSSPLRYTFPPALGLIARVIRETTSSARSRSPAPGC